MCMYMCVWCACLWQRAWTSKYPRVDAAQGRRENGSRPEAEAVSVMAIPGQRRRWMFGWATRLQHKTAQDEDGDESEGEGEGDNEGACGCWTNEWAGGGGGARGGRITNDACRGRRGANVVCWGSGRVGAESRFVRRADFARLHTNPTRPCSSSSH